MQRVRFLTLMATAAFAACGESTGVVGDLTEAEATELASVVFMTAFNSAAAAPAGGPQAAGPLMAPYAYSEDVDFTAECAIDGFVNVSASLDVSGDSESEVGRIEYFLTLGHEGCTAASQNETVFTVDGAPSVTVHLVAESDVEGNVTLVGSLDGVIDWSAEGHDGGRCEIDLALSGAISQSAGTVAFEVEGSVCRFSIAASSTLG